MVANFSKYKKTGININEGNYALLHQAVLLSNNWGPDFNANAYFFLAPIKYAHLDVYMKYFIS
jgi:hypothetical protein